MMARLVVIDGPDRGRVLTIPPEGGLVGRGETCAMRLGDASVSREHFRIGVRDGRPLVIDLGSTNQTLVNGEAVNMRALVPGDRIEIGMSTLEVIGEGDIVCTGTHSEVAIDLNQDKAFRKVGRHTEDVEMLGRVVNVLSYLGHDLPAAATTTAAAEHGAVLAAQALGAVRVQILRDSDGDKGQAYAVVASHTADENCPPGSVPVERSLLVRVADSGRSVAAVDGQRASVMAPLQIEGVPGLLIADRAEPPWDRAGVEIATALARVIGAAIDAQVRRDRAGRERLAEGAELDGDSAVAARLREWATWLAQRPEHVVLIGEPGVGKERVATAVHAKSPRAVGPFVPVRCAALSESWLESELFGHEAQGSPRRTGKIEAARGGTLFLDELAAMPPRCQKRLARALDLGFLERPNGGRIPIDIRIVASSCHDVGSMVGVGAMREDLYRRLAGQVVVVPPLRERRGDISVLAEKFLYQLAAEAGQRRDGFASDAASFLNAHDWHANVRELRNVVERVVIFGGDSVVTLPEVQRAMLRHG